MLLVRSGFLAECLALVQDPQRLLGNRGLVSAAALRRMSRSAIRLSIRMPSTPAPDASSVRIRLAMATSRGE